MISLHWGSMNGQIGALMAKYDALPRHIAKKHLKAAIRRAMKGGVPVLKSLTPKGKTKNVRAAVARNERGRFLPGSGKKKKQRGGALRRAVTVRVKYIGTNRSGFVWGVIGYKAGMESRKALWLEFGTTKISPRRTMDRFRAKYHGPAAKMLAGELRKALAKAARDKAPGKGYRRKRG